MSQQLFIPKTIRVGYQHRNDTYTGKLAYVIYFDSKGKLRKESSWKSWCQLEDRYEYTWVGSERVQSETPTRKGIPFNDFENLPTEGFVLNKKVGDYKSDWNHRMAHIRVFDPRGFEFEISVENLLFILAEGNCTSGKGLEGKFVYSWHGTELVLLPTHCNDYKNCTKFTDLQSKKVGLRELVPGYTYLTKSQTEYIYMGRLSTMAATDSKTTPKHVFYNAGQDSFTPFKSGKDLAECKSSECHPNFAELLEVYDVQYGNTKIVKSELIPFAKGERLCELNGVIYHFNVVKYDSRYGNYYDEDEYDDSDSFVSSNFDPTKNLIRLDNRYYLSNGVFKKENVQIIVWPTVFKAPELERNPHYRPDYKKPLYGYSSYSYWDNVYQKEFLDDRYAHTDCTKVLADLSLQKRKIVLTTEDGRKFITDTYKYKQYEA